MADTAAMPADPTDDHAAALAAVRAQFAQSTDGVIEAIARDHGLTPRQVADCLPAETGAAIPGRCFQAVMDDLTDWGRLMVLVHTPDLILECASEVPKGSQGHGFFNLGGGQPLSGHIRHNRCAAIRFLSRPFMGSASHAILFFNDEGGIMFKVFVGRDDNRQLKPDQVARFERLRDRLVAEAAQAGDEMADRTTGAEG
ncbi:heme utilization cystosolic carrier protein HutX [Rhodothalassium salexigens]|uniref:heme utilization cystosolic carrier protein HutX n=1 Tax=Rhodothalassium salexigens TaxID=1086 RepID=UPI001911941C|nr:heme utilization cystosolic carrier protein HutX [Rhodothalassium salexigens]